MSACHKQSGHLCCNTFPHASKLENPPEKRMVARIQLLTFCGSAAMINLCVGQSNIVSMNLHSYLCPIVNTPSSDSFAFAKVKTVSQLYILKCKAMGVSHKQGGDWKQKASEHTNDAWGEERSGDEDTETEEEVVPPTGV